LYAIKISEETKILSKRKEKNEKVYYQNEKERKEKKRKECP